MFFFVLAENEDIVQVNHCKVIKVFSQHIVHEILECGRCVGKAKRQNSKFAVTVTSAKGGLGDVRRLDTNLMVSADQVKRCEPGGSLKSLQALINSRQWVFIAYRHFVQRTEINARSHLAVLFLDN
jgi:hypothetical protein